MHEHDAWEKLISKHPGSKTHKGGKSKRQKKRDKAVRKRAIVDARVATERAV